MRIKGHGTKFSRAGDLASRIYASMYSLFKLYQKSVNHNPFLYVTLLNNETYSMKKVGIEAA